MVFIYSSFLINSFENIYGNVSKQHSIFQNGCPDCDGTYSGRQLILQGMNIGYFYKQTNLQTKNLKIGFCY